MSRQGSEVTALRIFERWMIVPGMMLLVGAAGAVNKVIYGEHALGTTAAVPWGVLIAGYVFFAAAATGVGLVASAGHFSRKAAFQSIEKRGLFLALALLLPGFGLIGIELGNPLHMIYILLSPNFSSGIWWMGFLYSIYMALLFVECYFSQVSLHNKNLKFIRVIAVLNKIAAVCNLGAIFAVIATRPFWYGYYFPVFILITAVLSGAAALVVMLYLTGKKEERAARQDVLTVLANVIFGSLSIMLLLHGWKMYAGFNSNLLPVREAATALIHGPLAIRFWGGEIFIGFLLPFGLLFASRKNVRNILIAAMAVLIGVFFMRIDFVTAGQIVPQMVVGGTHYGMYHTYVLSWTELALITGALGATILLYAWSERRFNLDAEEASTFIGQHDTVASPGQPGYLLHSKRGDQDYRSQT
jgi:molybdopterin-containing oxidoreductase family membrane subunit